MALQIFSNGVDCPVDGATVDEHRVRTGAFMILLLSIAYLLTGNWIIPAFMLADFLIRGFNLFSYSLVSLISGTLIRTLNWPPKPTGRAPKRFAAFTGAVFSALILAALLFGLSLTSQILTAILLLFAALESLAGFCAGCYVYSLLRVLKSK